MPQKPEPAPIEKWQIRQIHALCKALGLDVETYRPLREKTKEDAMTIINALTRDAVAAGKWNSRTKPGVPPAQKAPDQMVKRMTYEALACAIHYSPLRPYHLDNGETLDGDDLRHWLKRRWELSHRNPQGINLRIPTPIQRWMYNGWINPTANRWLVDGGFLPAIPEEPATLYYAQLPKAAVEYLLKRFKAMHRAIDNKEASTDRTTTTPKPVPTIKSYHYPTNEVTHV